MMPAIDTSRFIAAARDEARGEELRDVDSLANWLSIECAHASSQPLMPLFRDETAEDFKAWTNPALLALLFDEGQPAQTLRAVRDVLADRFCARDGAHERIECRAAALAVEAAYREREEHREAA